MNEPLVQSRLTHAGRPADLPKRKRRKIGARRAMGRAGRLRMALSAPVWTGPQRRTPQGAATALGPRIASIGVVNWGIRGKVNAIPG
jgi:hypothetical protein